MGAEKGSGQKIPAKKHFTNRSKKDRRAKNRKKCDRGGETTHSPTGQCVTTNTLSDG